MASDSYFADSTTPVASVGLLRGRNAQPLVAARNAANNGDVEVVRVNASDLIVISNLATPTSAGDAASKGYADSLATAATPSSVGTSNSVGTSATLARSDHVHAHGNQTSASLHAEVDGATNGFMSADSFTRLNTVFPSSSPPYNVTGVTTAWFLAEVNDGNSGSSKTVDFTTGQTHKVTLTAACAFTFVFPGVGHFQLKLTQDATGSRVPTYAVSGGTVYKAKDFSLSTSASAVDIVSIYFDGVNAWQVVAATFA